MSDMELPATDLARTAEARELMRTLAVELRSASLEGFYIEVCTILTSMSRLEEGAGESGVDYIDDDGETALTLSSSRDTM